ncbi:hypothetical protein FJTKL_03114 [Diaporthe vaccinii]|uniref:Secreted protein n=1 Tax=Diaporthe vaccinii TaxID=105482 RepID=A0ABR4DW07_9PEZI
MNWVQYRSCCYCLLLPSSLPTTSKASIDQSVDLQPALPTSNLRACTVRGLALAFPPACVGYPLNLQQAHQPLCGPGSAASSTSPYPALAFTVNLCVCVAEVGWPRHSDEAAPRRPSKATHSRQFICR